MTRPDLVEVELDVRDDLRNRREPFSRIMGAVDALRDGEMLHLRAIFQPAPLYKVLGARGLAHETERHADDDWSVWFWRTEAEPARAPKCDGDNGGRRALRQAAAPPMPDEQWLDVRSLEPPEPMVRTLAALESLPMGHTLVQVNARVPQFLLPILAERGFAYTVDESRDDRVLVRIRRQPSGEPVMSSSPAVELDVRVIQPREKHPTIFRTFDGLKSGQSMVIINDHDPRPLRYQLMAERPDTFEWTYEAEGPETWRVRIDRR